MMTEICPELMYHRFKSNLDEGKKENTKQKREKYTHYYHDKTKK